MDDSLIMDGSYLFIKNLSALYTNNHWVRVLNFPYTAPADGLVRLTLYKNNSTTSWNAEIFVNSISTSYFIGTVMPYHSRTVELLVRKGDVVNYVVEAGGESFVYCDGEFVSK